MVASMKTEILGVADAVAREKGIDREVIISAMEVAIQKASRAKYGHDRDVRTRINRETGEIVMHAYREVVEEVENESAQLTLEEARRLNPDIKIGEFIVDDLPPFDFGRVAAQTAKQVIFQQVREAERSRQYEEYKNRVGDIVNVVVKRVEFGNVMVELGQAEGIIMRDKLIPREAVRVGDRIRAYIEDVRPEPRGSQVFLSRTHPQFLAKLFTQEVPEIYDGQIEIKAVARDPGSRAKFSVYVGDKSIDPVGACVGMRGSRVQNIVTELQGEKVDIIPWSDNPAVFIVNAMVPAEVSKVILDEEAGKVDVIVPDDQLSLAIGRRGQNVRLASILTGWNLDVSSETQESERRAAEVKEISAVFIEAMDIDDVIAHLLISEGFKHIEEIAMVPLDDLTSIEGFEEDLAQELQSRAQAYVKTLEEKHAHRLKDLGVADDLAGFDALSKERLVTLAEKGIKNLDDFADLSGDELVDLIDNLSVRDANALIMKAREHWFAEEDAAKAAAETKEAAAAELSSSDKA
ncbi:MAG: transcription termination/antitermination protein NusA [Alphaproteobacteria bacterium]|nr:transcription termination/antitermination protein NusA [Alphaproteobacteria bacterium]NCQ67294.1 transcription termination/antitermination protein NusA [Alphaproteobacteria bacterium]NCT06739.1 transcription termination/antitermination protein NusA [Alphaproteobacteria bacterium]